jgi:Ca2+-binding EF-hand superfamily protein
MPPKAMASSTNSYWAIGIVTREGDKHGAGAVTMAFARSNRDFKLLPRHRERALDMSLLHHPHVLDEYQGYFKSAKLRAREGHTQGHLHVCSCRYPDAKLRGLGMFGAVAPKAQQEPAPEPEEEMVMPTKAQRVELFDLMDTSGDGSLTDREVAIAVSTQWPQFDNQEALKVAMHTADTSQDGTIGRKEFGLLLEYLVFFNNLWSKFAELDSGGDGKLDVEEFKKGCKMVGIKLTAAEAESEFATMDMDGGGTIVFAEFCVWSARRAAHGHDDDDDDEADGVSGELALERDSDESQDSDEDKAPTPPRTPTPPLRSASGRRVRVPELARGRMTRLPKNDQAQETQHPTHFTVWIITKQSNTANIYPHLRNLAHVFMSDSSNLVPFLGLHRDWLAGDLKVYDPNVVTKPPHGVLELLLPVESKPKQTALFGAPPPAAATSSKQHTGDHNHGSSKTPRDAHTPKTPRGDASARVHTPRSRDAKRAAHAGEDGATAEEREQAAAAAEELRAVKEAAVLKLQARVRGMLGRITKTKLIGAVGGLTKDSNEMQLARERRHLWQTRREIAVIDWPQELRRAAIAADLPALQEALKHCSADASASGTSTNINTATEVGMTALHYACCSGKDEIVMELLQVFHSTCFRPRLFLSLLNLKLPRAVLVDRPHIDNVCSKLSKRTGRCRPKGAHTPRLEQPLPLSRWTKRRRWRRRQR